MGTRVLGLLAEWRASFCDNSLRPKVTLNQWSPFAKIYSSRILRNKIIFVPAKFPEVDYFLQNPRWPRSAPVSFSPLFCSLRLPAPWLGASEEACVHKLPFLLALVSGRWLPDSVSGSSPSCLPSRSYGSTISNQFTSGKLSKILPARNSFNPSCAFLPTPNSFFFNVVL